VLLYGFPADHEETMIMNLNTIYTHVREVARETGWVLEKMEEYEHEATETRASHMELCSIPDEYVAP